jgi:hypothetical protein
MTMIDDDTDDIEVTPQTKCRMCGLSNGLHSHDCALYTWYCSLCGALLNKHTFSDHYASHRALAIET